MGRRRRSTTASCAGPSAAYGRASSARWRAPGMCRIACSSTQAASRSTAAPAAQKGGLGSWYRPHEGRDRKSAGEGKSVSVRVDLGGGRIIKKKKVEGENS